MANTASSTSTFHTTLRFGQAVGATAFFLGFILSVLGLAGVVELVFEAGTLNAKLANASPGVVFATLGFLVLWRYRPKKSHSVTETNESVPPEVIAAGVMLIRAVTDSSEKKKLVQALNDAEKARDDATLAAALEAATKTTPMQPYSSYSRSETSDSAMLSSRR